jgi:hypothetical protein
MFEPLVLFALLSQPTAGLGDWIQVTAEQTPGSGVTRIEPRRAPPLDACEDVTFPSSGMDFISESQFTLILEVVVDRTGRIERFRQVHQFPGWNPKLNGPIKAALAQWRYRVTEPTRPDNAVGFVITLSKAGGMRTTDDCARIRARTIRPSNRRLHPAAGAP